MTIDPRSGVHAKGKYLGLTETGTRHSVYPDVKTGLDHLVELGVNTVQIMPVQDFENDESSSEYGWGYMPVHFNSPDGWYASRTDTPVRIKELKEMISAFHSKGIKVVMVGKMIGQRGPERIIIGGGAIIYYTPDHYRTFIEMKIIR